MTLAEALAAFLAAINAYAAALGGEHTKEIAR